MNEHIYIEAKAKKIDVDIKKALKKANINYPHPSLAFFKATYAKFEEANGNNVILADSVKDNVSDLIGTQMNKNHYRYGNIMGQIINAYVTKNNEIEIIFSFHKSVYADEYQQALDLMEQGKLTVSFELRVDKENVEVVKGGAKKLSKVDWEGVGLLFAVTPAYRNAFVLETAMKQIENLFQSEDRQLVYASVKNIAQKWAQIGQLIEETVVANNNGGIEMDKKTNDALVAKYKENLISEFGEDAVKDWSDEDFLNEEKIQALRDSLSPEEKEVEASEEEQDAENKASESEEEEQVSDEEAEDKEEVEAEKFETVVEEKVKQTVTYDNEANTETVKTESERKVEQDGDVKVEEKVEKETIYTYAQVEEIKAGYEKEIEFLKEFAQQVVVIRSEMGDFVAELSDEELFDEAKMEVAKLKKENAELKASQSLETAEEEKTEEVEEKKEEKVEEEKAEDKEKEAEDKEEKTEEVEEKKEEKVEEVEEKKEDEDMSTGHEEVVEEEIDKEQAVKKLVKQRYEKK
ncbi:MAG: hypothetical protein ACTSWD_02415 [Candidatus Heimdallarchaeota archaeon]